MRRIGTFPSVLIAKQPQHSLHERSRPSVLFTSSLPLISTIQLTLTPQTYQPSPLKSPPLRTCADLGPRVDHILLGRGVVAFAHVLQGDPVLMRKIVKHVEDGVSRSPAAGRAHRTSPLPVDELTPRALVTCNRRETSVRTGHGSAGQTAKTRMTRSGQDRSKSGARHSGWRRAMVGRYGKRAEHRRQTHNRWTVKRQT